MGIDVSVLIVTYRCRNEVLAALATLQDATHAVTYEVIVVDNASGDDTLAAIADRFPTARTIDAGTNLGFARAVNLAAEHAEGEFILLLNPDTLVLDGAIDELVRFARVHPEYAAYGGRTLDADHHLDPRSAWAAPTLWSVTTFAFALASVFSGPAFDPEAMPGWPRDTVRTVDIITGCFLLMRRDTWDAFGGFDPVFFVYGEDADLGLRLQAAGRRSVIDPNAVIVHTVGASSKQRSDKMQLVMQGRATLLRKHWHGWRRRYGLAAMQTGAGVRALGEFVTAHRPGHAPITRGTWGDVWRARAIWRKGFPRQAGSIRAMAPVSEST